MPKLQEDICGFLAGAIRRHREGKSRGGHAAPGYGHSPQSHYGKSNRLAIIFIGDD
jgi:hypothetical protein